MRNSNKIYRNHDNMSTRFDKLDSALEKWVKYQKKSRKAPQNILSMSKCINLGNSQNILINI